MDIFQVRSREEYESLRAPVLAARLGVDSLIARGHGQSDTWQLPGYCDACLAPSRFLLDWQCSDGVNVNYRERLSCPSCALNNRQRFIARHFRGLVGERPIRDVYLYEQVTPFHSWIRRTFPELSLQASEFLGFEYAPGQVVDGIRHEDALQLSFEDASLDVIVSNDVFEHVPNIHRALDEAHRVLRKGGCMLISIPFCDGYPETQQRAILAQGRVVHMASEVYHGNPVSEKGSLVFYDYGWDFLDFCRRAGFKDAYLLCYHSMFHGYLGGAFQLVIVAQK